MQRSFFSLFLCRSDIRLRVAKGKKGRKGRERENVRACICNRERERQREKGGGRKGEKERGRVAKPSRGWLENRMENTLCRELESRVSRLNEGQRRVCGWHSKSPGRFKRVHTTGRGKVDGGWSLPWDWMGAIRLETSGRRTFWTKA